MQINKDNVITPGTGIVAKESVNAFPVGWNPIDTLAPAATADDFTKVPTTVVPPPTTTDELVLTDEPVNATEVISHLEDAYDRVPSEKKAEVEAIIADVDSGPNLLRRHMDALSKKINEALLAETVDYERIHVMMLRFCMIHMRHVVKDDQEYISKIGDQIKVQSGKIRDSYNTWPVVTITLVSSAVSIVGGVAGFSTIIRPASEIARTFAQNAQQISTMSTGISGVSSLLNSRNEGNRGVLQNAQRRDQDKEEEKKSSKHGTKDTQKGFRTAIEELFRNIRETISSILRG